MAISPVSSSSNIPPPADSLRQAFGQLTSAIQSGNLSAAQSAYTTLSQAQPNQDSNPFSQALSQIGDALQSGDIGKAQAALAALQQQMQGLKGAQHHHGPRPVGGADQSQAAAPVSVNSDPTTPPTSTNLIDVTV